MNIHRLKLCLLIGLLCLTAILSACGKEETAPNPAHPSEPEKVDATQTFTDALGRNVDIPRQPQRIVTTQYLPEMIAVGVKPIGAVSHLLNNYKSLADRIDGIEDVGAANDPNLEKLLQLKPDLIIAAEWNEAQLDQLSKIAPTVVIKWEGRDAFQHFRDVAGLLGKKQEAENWISAYEAKSVDVRATLAKHVRPDETFGVVVIGGYEKGQLRIYGDLNVGYTLYQTLQFKMTDAVKREWDKGGHELGMSVSLETLPEYASADRLFVVKFDNDPEFLQQVEDSSLWHKLPAVQNNNIYTVDSKLWFSYDILSFEAQLDDALRLLSQ